MINLLFSIAIGGYIGLFIGYTISQIPELCLKLITKSNAAWKIVFGGGKKNFFIQQ